MGQGPSKKLGSRKIDLSKSVITQAALGLAQRKYAPKYLKLVLKIARENPVESQIASQAGMSICALRNCVALSKKGRSPDIFDLPTPDGGTERFHIQFEDAVETGWGVVEDYARKAATGMLKEVLTYKGRVRYKLDPGLIGLGFTGPAAYLLDNNGDPVPETIRISDFEMTRFLLKGRLPKIYGTRMQVDHDHKVGGVLVVGVTRTSKELETIGPQKYEDIQDVEFENVTEEPQS